MTKQILPIALVATLIITAIPVQDSLAAEVRFVGEITDGPSAPTSLVLLPDGLTALEPFTQTITSYSADGVLAGTVDIVGEPAGLSHFSGNTYLFCESELGAVHRMDLDTGQQEVLMTGVGQPVDVVRGPDRSFVLDASGRRILTVDQLGNLSKAVTLADPADGSDPWVAQLAYDSVRNIFYVLDQTHSRVLAYGEDGAFLGAFCSFGGGDGEISRGGDLVVDLDGWIYLADRYQGRIAVFKPDWTFALFIDPTELGRPHLATPTGLAVDDTGLLYVSATEGAAIHIFHLDKAAAPGVLLARAIDPVPGDTMPANDLLFVAGIQAPASSAAEVVADFQVFDRADMATPVVEVAGLPLEEPTVIADLVIGSVSWQPDIVLEADHDYGWRARARTAIDTGEWSVLVDFTPTAAKLPFELEQNVPNPFNPMTIIHFSLATGERAELTIYDIRGRLVSRQDLSGFGPGRHQVVWEGRDDGGRSLPSGIYFYRLVSGHDTATRKMVLAR